MVALVVDRLDRRGGAVPTTGGSSREEATRAAVMAEEDPVALAVEVTETVHRGSHPTASSRVGTEDHRKIDDTTAHRQTGAALTFPR